VAIVFCDTLCAMDHAEKLRRNGIRQREKKNRNRSEILRLLGDACKKCGFTDSRAIHIDHVNGGGGIDRKSSGSGFRYYQRVLKLILTGSTDYQLLCANCNAIKLADHERRKPKHVGEIPEIPKLRPCGTHSAYHRGCRCELCCEAHRVYCREKMRKQRLRRGQKPRTLRTLS